MPSSRAAQLISAEVNVPQADFVGGGVGLGVGVGVGDLLGGGVCEWPGVGEGDGDGLTDEPPLDDCVGSAGVVVDPGLSITTTCGGSVDGVEVADDVADGVTDGVAEGVGLWEAERDGLLDGEAELFGTTMSGVLPGLVPRMKPSFGWPDAACGVGEIAFDPMTTTVAVAADVTPARSAAVTTVLVEVAASAEGSLIRPASFIPTTSPWALRTIV